MKVLRYPRDTDESTWHEDRGNPGETKGGS
jgi:hypothetical protein